MENPTQNLLPFYQFATEHASVGIHAVDAHGKTLIYNEKMMEIEGLHLEDVHDRSILELFHFDKEDSTLLKVLQNKEPIQNVKQTYWNQNGQEITTINDTFPIIQDGKFIGAIEFARDITTLEKLVYQPMRRYGESITFSQITAVSEPMQEVIKTAKKAVAARLPVLLVGESGTGKDLIAEAIHHASTRAAGNFTTLFCQRADRAMIERLKKQLQKAEPSTIFCERIEYLPLDLQQEYLTLAEEYKQSSHQFIASIGSDPIDLIATGKLHKELYYFFALTIIVPPLNTRREDIKPFVNDYLRRYSNRFRRTVSGLSTEVEQLFMEYDWPGNLKELEILLDDIMSMVTNEDEITYELLPLHFKWKTQTYSSSSKSADYFVVQQEKELLPLDDYLREAEEYYLNKVMEKYNHNITQASAALGMSRQNLQYRLRKIRK
ncbi:sigma 54-interacting transcriptional regulator [Rummeliibacillus sp. G93]|uniref:sigma 54-interacting transcriptional regulator n=1 Tax=Rummeliibacillus sp. G93 TaxID=2939494 RepID=UPI00201BBC3A|nr:sigma 54-interacting transcriptional regulator [Rummeliibacillus sp. G93]UQW96587.1 sigma 54-interacting transcriptional regulator [Rummeliibacillus sp. G93]